MKIRLYDKFDHTDWEEIPDERIDSIEKYKDCFQPKSDEKPNSYLNEEVAKAFQIGLAFGFAKKYDEMDKVIEEVKKAATPKPETVTEFADRCRECGAKYGKMFDQKTGHWNIPFLMHKELEIPISECREAYKVAIDYLRSQADVRAGK